MPTPDENLVRRTLAVRERGSLIRKAMIDAWDVFERKYPERGWWRRKSTRAGILWEYSVEHAIAAFEGDAGCKPIPHDDTMSFIFDQVVLVRFKKADIELKSRNYPTSLASLFHAHEAVLPGFGDLHRIEAAYVLNLFQTKVDWIGVVAREKKRLLWQFELDAPSNVTRLPIQKRIDTAADRVLRGKKLTLDQPSETETE